MLQSEREILFNRELAYLSVGISEGGIRYGQYPIPWDSTANAYKMILPNVYISKEDINDKEIMCQLKKFKVEGCYIFCELENYDFLNDFVDMKDLNIYSAYNLRDFSFLENCTKCDLLFVSRAHLSNIDQIIGPHGLARPRCLALYDCIVDDINNLKSAQCSFGELIICNPKSRNERKRWSGIRGLKYYDSKQE